MTIITIKEDFDLGKNEFENIKELQMYLMQSLELSASHKYVLDQRIQEANESPEKYISLKDLKSK